VRIDIRPVAKLRGGGPLNVPAALGPLFDALTSTAVDLSTLRVVCDWIQYRNNFSEPVQCRPVMAERPLGPATGDARAAEIALEIGIDLRRFGDADMAMTIKTALAEHANRGNPARTVLEPWVPTSESCIWRFNTLYWQALKQWEQATGREYEQALPGGQSDARDTETVRELILELFRVWDELDARHALPEELYVVELGVGHYLVDQPGGNRLSRADQPAGHHQVVGDQPSGGAEDQRRDHERKGADVDLRAAQPG